MATHLRTGLLPEGFDYAQVEFGGAAAFLADDPPAAYAAAFLLAGADSGPEAISVDAPAHRRPPFTEITCPVM